MAPLAILCYGMSSAFASEVARYHGVFLTLSMARITLRFYEELSDHLTPERRKVPFAYRFCDGRTVAELLRELGVPCDAVELVLANGESVDFTYTVRDGDRISVYPVFESLDVSPVLRVRLYPLRHPCFMIVEPELRGLAACLRLCGFDVVNRKEEGTGTAEPGSPPRIRLSRDPAAGSGKTHFYHVRTAYPRRQLVEVLNRLDLWRAVKPAGRCPRCNLVLQQDVPKPGNRVPQDTEPRIGVCPRCHRRYEVERYERLLRSLARRNGHRDEPDGIAVRRQRDAQREHD